MDLNEAKRIGKEHGYEIDDCTTYDAGEIDEVCFEVYRSGISDPLTRSYTSLTKLEEWVQSL